MKFGDTCTIRSDVIRCQKMVILTELAIFTPYNVDSSLTNYKIDISPNTFIIFVSSNIFVINANLVCCILSNEVLT